MISILSHDVINKIAAGEVIERPASVVKELVENALDANATKIVVTINKSGRELIQVKDNGAGMTRDDLEKCHIQHATSKISCLDDLYKLDTLGFRGEALASIAGVATLEVTTCQTDAYTMMVEASSVQFIKDTVAPRGTTISVHNLFKNTPVRAKFLRSDTIERRHIIDIVSRYALQEPHVEFTLMSDQKTLLSCPATTNLAEKVYQVYGIQGLKQVVYKNDVTVTGYISTPQNAKTDSHQQTMFINGRYVKCPVIKKAVYDAYHSSLFIGRHPFFVLNITIDPALVDVNVHPRKMEVKYSNPSVVRNAVYEAVLEQVQATVVIPEMKIEPKTVTEFTPRYQFEPATQQELPVFKPVQIGTTTNVVQQENVTRVKKQFKTLPEFRVLGQVHKTFFLAETKGGVLVIDQHDVQERVLYERFMKQYMASAIEHQSLLTPKLIELSQEQAEIVESKKQEIGRLGYIMDHAGGTDYYLRTVPKLLGRDHDRNVVELIDDIRSNKRNHVEYEAEEIITRMSCRASIKAGDDCTVTHITKLLKELDECELPYTCPHGRSIFISYDVVDIEKQFKRHG